MNQDQMVNKSISKEAHRQGEFFQNSREWEAVWLWRRVQKLLFSDLVSAPEKLQVPVKTRKATHLLGREGAPGQGLRLCGAASPPTPFPQPQLSSDCRGGGTWEEKGQLGSELLLPFLLIMAQDALCLGSPFE